MDKKNGAQDSMAFDQEAVTKAIDDAVAAERENQRGIRAALRVTRPLVGELAMDSFETPEDVYKEALGVLKIDVKGVHPSAYKTILERESTRGKDTRRSSRREEEYAQDAADGDSFDKMFPEAARIRSSV